MVENSPNYEEIEIAFAEQNVILAKEALLKLLDTEQVNINKIFLTLSQNIPVIPDFLTEVQEQEIEPFMRTMLFEWMYNVSLIAIFNSHWFRWAKSTA